VTRTVRLVALTATLLVVLPELAHACPVCFDPRDENRLAFLGTTVFLSLLPLAIVAGTLLFIRHRSRQASRFP
jgi:hypothetical protein